MNFNLHTILGSVEKPWAAHSQESTDAPCPFVTSQPSAYQIHCHSSTVLCLSDH